GRHVAPFPTRRSSDLKGRSYQHNAAQLHQIVTLQEAAKNGAAAFLLVHSVEAERVFMLGLECHNDDLIQRRPIELWERGPITRLDRKRRRLNSSHGSI